MNPLLRRRLPIVSVLAIVLVGLLLFLVGHWRRGAVVIAGAAVVGAVLRVCIPERDVGVLAVRSKQFDIVLLLFLAALFVTAAALGD